MLKLKIETKSGLSIGVEKWSKRISGNVSTRLAKNGMASSGIELPMVGNCQCLPFGRGADPAQFDMTPRLFVITKPNC
jgi:hypothetical protein